MRIRFSIATILSLCALPLLCTAQEEQEAEPVDPEAAIIRLDPNAENLDVWSQLRDASEDADREPGRR